MKTNLKKRLLKTVGVAIVAMLFGSNIGYALNNYDILKHNLSYAMFSDTEGEEEYVGASGTFNIGTEAREGEPIMSVDQCPLQTYQRYATERYVRTSESFVHTISSGTSISLNGKAYTFDEMGIKFDSKKDKSVAFTYTIRDPECADNQHNCCAKSHLTNQQVCNLTWQLLNK